MAGYQFLDRCNHLKRSDKEVKVTLFVSDNCTALNIYSQKKSESKNIIHTFHEIS